jgi:hypothetical protein
VLGAHRAADGVDDDRTAGVGDVGLAAPEPARHRLDDRFQRQSLVLVELGREPHLGVRDAVVREIGDGLPGDALDRLRRLHDRECVLERGEVLEQVAGLGATREPGLQVVGIGRRQRPADRVRQFQDRRHPHATVEMVVEQDLGESAGLVERQHGRGPTASP